MRLPFKNPFARYPPRLPQFPETPYPFNFDLGGKFMRPKLGIDHWPYRGNAGNLYPLGSFVVAPLQADALRFAAASSPPPQINPTAPTSFDWTVPVYIDGLAKGSQ